MELKISRSVLYDRVLEALQSWKKSQINGAELLSELLIVQQAKKNIDQTVPALYRLATNEVLLQGIEQLKLEDRASAELLIARFLDAKQIMELTVPLNLSADQIKRAQRRAIEQLIDHLIVIENEQRQLKLTEWSKFIPRLNHIAFGIDHHANELANRLSKQADPWIIILNGIGGIGKSVLAQQVAYTLMPEFQFKQYVWVRVTPNHSEALAELKNHIDQILLEIGRVLGIKRSGTLTNQIESIKYKVKKEPTLVIIDNIEFVGELNQLIKRLSDFVSPSKFLITSRVRSDLECSHYSLNQLSDEPAKALIRHQAHIHEVKELVTNQSEWPELILRKVGGNPLAIKLIIALSRLLPIQSILSDFEKIETQKIEDLYVKIYWQIWQRLDENSQTILESCLMANIDGMGLDQLAEISQLPRRDLFDGISELDRCSMIEILGHGVDKRYGIHRLTESFLMTEIVNWPSNLSQHG